MQHKITNILVQDFLPSAIVLPKYALDSKLLKGLFLKNENWEIEWFSGNKENILLPLFALKEPWVHPSWAKDPEDLVSALKELFLSAQEACFRGMNTATVSSVEEGYIIAKSFYSDQSMEFGHLLCSKEVLVSNMEFLVKERIERRSIGEKGWPKHILMFFPEPEHTGVLVVSHDSKQFGAFVVLNNILVMILEDKNDNV